MKVYNIEVFTKDFVYKSSYPISEFQYKYDYLSVENSKLKIKKIIASEGDYLKITSKEGMYYGIVTSCEFKNSYYELKYKQFISITDVNVHFNKDDLITMSLEEWIAKIITETFGNNTDAKQNLIGLTVIYIAETFGAIMDLNENIDNFYDILTTALVSYGVVVYFAFDAKKKAVTVTVKKNTDKNICIEAGLPNIIDKNLTFKKKEGSLNKLTVYNSNDETQLTSYYALEDGTITTDQEATTRILPVIFDTVFVEYTAGDSKTFEEKAYEKAFTKLTPPVYDNLIEIECNHDDALIKPMLIEIGQQVTIIHQGIGYQTILTGKEIEKTTKLIFGAVRLDLTKILRRRMR